MEHQPDTQTRTHKFIFIDNCTAKQIIIIIISFFCFIFIYFGQVRHFSKTKNQQMIDLNQTDQTAELHILLPPNW